MRSLLFIPPAIRRTRYGFAISTDGSVIDGLFCAGNAMANPFGSKAVGAGTTLGPCLTWGYICARTALASAAVLCSSSVLFAVPFMNDTP